MKMAQDNQVMIVGNVTRDPELRYTPNGAALVKFGVAVSRRVRDENGQWKDADTSFFDVTAWRSLAENVAESITQGSRVVIVGRLRTNSWETPEGDRRSKVEIEAEEVAPSLKWATAKVERQSRGASATSKSNWSDNVSIGAGGPQEESPIDA
jgi:single-strand DNA-binding protein